MKPARLFTIGFTRKSAEAFFTRLQSAGVERVLDVRLHNVSQLAGFTKRDDLEYFLKAIGRIGYVHLPELAPDQALFEAFKRKQQLPWDEFRRRYLKLLGTRKVEQTLDRSLFHNGCLLCSEANPEECHRSLAADYLRRHWKNLEIVHL
jgi:uncharacterized protein (DUF488 family)